MNRAPIVLLTTTWTLLAACGPGPADLDEAEMTADAPVVAGATAKTSMSVCWTNPACRRALIVSHGGDWNASNPYLSRAAFNRAAECGAHGVETPVRLTRDGVPVLAHSSPIEIWESLQCAGKRIEQMTASEVTSCRLFPSFNQKFQRLDSALDWANGRVILELDPKVSGEVPAILAWVIRRGAIDRAFFLINPDELPLLRSVPGWEGAHYMLRVRDPSHLYTEIQSRTPGVFMVQMDREFAGLTRADVASLIANQVHPSGLKALSESAQPTASVNNHLSIFRQGFDVILSYGCANGVTAARQISQERGL
ncbi:MAG: glycerophosphodiester phosphodiesterase family protein [Deltaproteobacteria bacterium]|nr:glycerophosphodiester phosphodiesterase family protein [Deltaproteobacteria bacterium]